MTVLAAALLIAAGGVASGQPSAPDNAAPVPPPSLVRARIAESRMLGIANCSSDPEALCMDSLVEARLEVLDGVAGPHLPGRLVVRYIWHIPAPRGAVGWWLVAQSRPSRRYRPAAPVRMTRTPAGRELCADRSELLRFGTLPAGGAARGEVVCYRRRGTG